MHEYQSEDITTLAKALIQVQRNLQPAFKDATNPLPTYLRRYTLSAMLGIVTEEDSDGECGEKSSKSGARQGRP